MDELSRTTAGPPPALRRATLLVHLGAGLAAVASGFGHQLSVATKVAQGRLFFLTDVRPGVLYGIGALLVASGLFTLGTWVGLWRGTGTRMALRAAGVQLVVVLWLSLAFLEPRGLPWALPPLLDMALLVWLVRSA
jgi:hypothetical protein